MCFVRPSTILLVSRLSAIECRWVYSSVLISVEMPWGRPKNGARLCSFFPSRRPFESVALLELRFIQTLPVNSTNFYYDLFKKTFQSQLMFSHVHAVSLTAGSPRHDNLQFRHQCLWEVHWVEAGAVLENRRFTWRGLEKITRYIQQN